MPTRTPPSSAAVGRSAVVHGLLGALLACAASGRMVTVETEAELRAALADGEAEGAFLLRDVALAGGALAAPARRFAVFGRCCGPTRPDGRSICVPFPHLDAAEWRCGGSAACTLDAGGASRVAEVPDGGALSLHNLVLVNGNAQGNGTAAHGGLLSVAANGQLTVDGCTLANGTASGRGGGVSNAGVVDFVASHVQGCTAGCGRGGCEAGVHSIAGNAAWRTAEQRAGVSVYHWSSTLVARDGCSIDGRAWRVLRQSAEDAH